MQKMKTLFIFILFFASTHSLFSQNELSDSLKVAYKIAKHDTIRCKILNELIESEYNDSIWPLYNQQLMELSQAKMKSSSGQLQKNYAAYYALTLNNLGFLYMLKSQSPKAYEYYNKALAEEERNNNKVGIATVYNNLGYLSRQEGKISKAIDYYHKALKIHLEVDNKLGIATAYNNIAYIFDRQNELKKALEYYTKALDMHLQAGNNDGAGICYGNMAAILSNFGDPNCKQSTEICKKEGLKIAVNYLIKSIELHKGGLDKTMTAGSMNHLAGLYDGKGDPYCNLSPEECEKISQQKALELYTTSLKLRQEADDINGLTQSYASIALHSLKNNDPTNALKYGLKSMEYAKLSGSPDRLIDGANVLHQIYKKQNKFREALEMHELLILMRDSISNNATKEMAIKKTFQIDFELQSTKDSLKNESKITEERLQNDLKVKQQRYYTYGGLVGFVLMLLIAIVSFRAYRNKQRANMQINRQKIEVERKNKIIEEQKMLVEEKQKSILDSINYAQRIQQALLPTEKYIEKNLKRLKNGKQKDG